MSKEANKAAKFQMNMLAALRASLGCSKTSVTSRSREVTQPYPSAAKLLHRSTVNELTFVSLGTSIRGHSQNHPSLEESSRRVLVNVEPFPPEETTGRNKDCCCRAVQLYLNPQEL